MFEKKYKMKQKKPHKQTVAIASCRKTSKSLC